MALKCYKLVKLWYNLVLNVDFDTILRSVSGRPLLFRGSNSYMHFNSNPTGIGIRLFHEVDGENVLEVPILLTLPP